MNFRSIPSFTYTSCPHLALKGLIDRDVLVALNSSIAWFQKNHKRFTPSAAEMTSLLDEFKKSKQSQSDSVNLASPARQAQQLDHEKVPAATAVAPAEQSPPETLASPEKNHNIGSTKSNSPKAEQRPEGSHTWKDALSASLIGSIIKTPASWFSRNNDRLNPPATEVQKSKARNNNTPSSRSRRQSETSRTVPRGNKTLPISSRSGRSLNREQPSTPTVATWKGGKKDSHLPFHLRGVLYENLPPEYQAVSEHMKPKEDAVVLVYQNPQDVAKKNLGEERRQELRQKAKMIVREQNRAEGDENYATRDRVIGGKRKRTVTVTQPKVFAAKLGPSTFGMPLNIDEDSSDEEIDFDVTLSPEHDEENLAKAPPFKKSRSSWRARAASAITDIITPHWADYESSEDSDTKDGSPIANEFVTTPPSEKTQLDRARAEWEALHPPPKIGPFIASNPSEQAKLDETVAWLQKFERECQLEQDVNLFKEKRQRERDEISRSFRTDAPQLEALRLADAQLKRMREEEAEADRQRKKQKKEERRMENAKFIQRQKECERLNRQERQEREEQRAAKARRESEKPKIYTPTRKAKVTDPFPSKRSKAGKSSGVLPLQESTYTQSTKAGKSSKVLPLQESSNTRLNKVREQALKYKPKVPSSLQVIQNMSPIHEKRLSGMCIDDAEVLDAVFAIKEEDIIPEPFRQLPSGTTDNTISKEASRALVQAYAEARRYKNKN